MKNVKYYAKFRKKCNLIYKIIFTRKHMFNLREASLYRFALLTNSMSRLITKRNESN